MLKCSCKPLNSFWRGKRAEDQYGLFCLRDVLQKLALESDLIIDHVTAETSVLLGQNTVSDACITSEPFVVHFLQHGCVYVYVIIDANLALSDMKAMQSTNILVQGHHHDERYHQSIHATQKVTQPAAQRSDGDLNLRPDQVNGKIPPSRFLLVVDMENPPS